MPQWEYSKIDLSRINPRSDDIELLNDAGQDGWELLTIAPNNIAYLKRSVQVAATQRAAPPKRGAARPG